ncbi:hypothetical protein [Streptomyces anandii]|uniref:hypothetical protein n=1 Tax=Streptomyces anandii TaxID=285454 RepID=UPI00379701A1
MVDDDARPERDKDAEQDRGKRDRERGQQDREQGPLDVLGRSTLVGGRAALPPPAPTAPPAGTAAGNGSAPPRPRPGPPGGRKDGRREDARDRKDGRHDDRRDDGRDGRRNDRRDDAAGGRARAAAAPAPRSAPEAEQLPSVFLEKLDEEAAPARAEKSARNGRKAAAQRENEEAAAREAEGRAAPPESAVTLWGGMGSGKSTLLAAVSKAVQDPLYGKWTMYPADHASQRFLGELARVLYRDRTFPNATLRPERPVRFTLAGDLTGTRYSRARRTIFRRRGERERDLTEFQVSVRDMPGEAFDLHSQTGAALGDQLIQDFVGSRAMVYVVDPVREWQVNGEGGPLTKDARQNADFFTEVLGRVATEINMRGERQGTVLPHSIAVCLAKFDDDRIFRFACEQGNVRVNPRTGQPEVMDAKRLFDGLCHALPHGSLRDIQRQIESYFAPERVGYFVCSAVGFWVDPDRGFDFENPYLINQVEDTVRFAAAPRPVNILEPFLFLRGFVPTQS